MNFNDENIDKIKIELEKVRPVFSWKTLTLATHGGNKGVWKKKFTVVIVPFIPAITCIISTNFHIGGLLFGLFFQVFGGLWIYYLTPNSSIEYHLTRLGIREKRNEVFPKHTFSILRGFAWFGVAVCIFSVLFMGPLALVGAGGLALMSFKFTGIGQQESYDLYLFDDDMMVFNVLDNNCIRMHSNPVEDACQSTLYFNDEDRELVLDNLKNVLPNAHYIDLKTESDLYENELFKSALAEGRRLYEEQQRREQA